MHCIHGQTINLLNSCLSLDSYIKPQPNLEGIVKPKGCLSLDSYIKPQQRDVCALANIGCLSLDSYIKPQHAGRESSIDDVVYLLIPTSNHNHVADRKMIYLLFIS